MDLRSARHRLFMDANRDPPRDGVRARAARVGASWGAAAVGALALLCAVPSAQAAISFEEGLARDPDSNQLLYREQHLVRRRDGQVLERLVLYRCSDGTAFARKRVDYRASAQAPSFSLEDARDGYGEGLRRGSAGDTVWVRESAGGSERSAPLRAHPQTVADAGFDEFIRRNWRPLLAGESVPLRFAVPARLESLGFKVSRIGAARFGGEPAELFRLRLGGWLGWIAPHIDVAYGRDSQRLLRFEGLSNLRADDGGSQLLARIEFPAPAVDAGEPQWRAFAGAPLSACRVRA
ncbi:hypothetical protein [Arenimonas terrae]|uniref:DUF1849 family protein n=1 Tax=Arenimonas terrae TaxID=2546226 RepID=A0A5C4RQC4_9GAMM|nr:hypothetical protein [Arenimonas terrae]TNJ33165.1 hypothetical protein E1B00_12755 [Arenimonas terrae]